MSPAEHDRGIDYVEFSATDLVATKRFYEAVFAWRFEDYGPDYTAFRDGRLGGGFAKAERVEPLVVRYVADLKAIEAAVKSAGGTITKETFSFPGGRRFHFSDPDGNELAVWSDQPANS